MNLTGDLAVFFNTAEFAEEAQFTRPGPPLLEWDLLVLFDEPGTLQKGFELEADSSTPSVIIKREDVPMATTPEDLLTVRGKQWKVLRYEPLDDGRLARLHLTED